MFYRQEKGSLDDVAMAVVVQQMVDSNKSGVLFTVDPVHGRKDRMVVEAAPAWAKPSCPARSPRTTTRSAATGW